jgi:hypothetical protein
MIDWGDRWAGGDNPAFANNTVWICFFGYAAITLWQNRQLVHFLSANIRHFNIGP